MFIFKSKSLLPFILPRNINENLNNLCKSRPKLWLLSIRTEVKIEIKRDYLMKLKTYILNDKYFR